MFSGLSFYPFELLQVSRLTMFVTFISYFNFLQLNIAITDDNRKEEEQDKPERRSAGKGKKTERPKSLPLDALLVPPDKESESKGQEGAIVGHQLKTPEPRAPVSPKSPKKGPALGTLKSPSKKRPLTKSLSMSSARGTRPTFHSRESSPFREPKASQSSHSFCEEGSFSVREAKKCASSPELTSPVTPHKGKLKPTFHSTFATTNCFTF